MKNNINLDELFSKAKSAEPVFSKDEARSLIENASIASTGNLYHKKIKGSTIMNIMSAAVLTAAAIGIISYNNLTDNNQKIEKNIQVVQNNKLDENKSTFNPNPTIAEIVNSSKNVETIHEISKNQSPADSQNFFDKENDLIKGVNVIELNSEQAKNIGINISNDGDYIEYVSGTNTQKPELVKIFVDWGVGINKIHSNDISKYANANEPRMITDNFGNKRISTFNNDENSNLSNLEFMDKDKNLYIKSVSSSDADKNVNIVMGGMNSTANADNKLQTMTYSNSLGWSIPQKPDNKSTSVKIDDDKVVMTTRNFYYNTNPVNSSSMNFTTVVDVDSILTNLNIDEIIRNSFSNFDEIRNKLDLPDSLKNRTMEQLIPMLTDSTQKYLNSLSKNFDIKMKLDGNVSNKMKLNLEEIEKQFKNTNIDSLLKSNFQNNMFVVSNDSLGNNSDFKFNNAQIKIVKNISDNPNVKISDITINSSVISDDFITLNKLVPVAINIPNAKDRNGKQLSNFRFLLWFEPNDDFVNKLPENIKVQIRKELSALQNANDVCENKEIVAGQNTYMDVWRACSGAIENLTAFPNPVENQLNLKFKLNESRIVSFALHSVDGRKVKELGRATLSNGEIHQNFEINGIESGMYLIVAQTDAGEQAVQRIVVK